MADVRMGVTCPNCGELIVGEDIVLDTKGGDDIVSLDVFSDANFYCGVCGKYIRVKEDIQSMLYSGDTYEGW